MEKNNGYQVLKKDVLGCYDAFLDFFTKAQIPMEGDSFAALKRQAEDIRADQFKLVVAGEAKSGKSTFINAYLGQEILPMDVLQCSSSVVEIKYGEKLTLTASYADGRQECVEGKTAIQEFLKEHAALDDEYRDIPVNTINNKLIIKSQGRPIRRKIIDNLLEEVEKENIHHLTRDVYEKKIRNYIEEMQKKWETIVTQMVITYPFDEESMRGISVFDSPGVHAAGRVGDVTDNYIEQADAIMFLRPLTGVSVEASSFKDFLESNSVGRNQNAMFLILTRAATESPDTIHRACDELVKIYGAQTTENRHGISQEQIIHVDSKAELYLNEFQSMSAKEINQKMKKLEQDEKLDPFLKGAKLDALKEDDAGNYTFSKELFLENLEKLSNFAAIDQALNLFGRKAKYLALDEFMQRMMKVYKKQEDDIKDKADLYRTKARNPREFAKKIKELGDEIESIKARMTKGLKHIKNDYTASGTRGGKIENDVEEIVKKYKEEAEKINGKDSHCLDRLEKLSFQQIDKFRDNQKRLQDELLQECDEKLKTVIQGGLVSFASLQPDFTPESFEKEKIRLKEEATEKHWKEGWCFGLGDGHWEYTFSQSNYYDLVKDHIWQEIEKIKNDAITEMRKFAENVISVYREQLDKNLESKKAELQEVEKDKRDNEAMMRRVQEQERWLMQIGRSKNDLQDYLVILDKTLSYIKAK